MGKTVAERILSKKCGYDVHAGEIVLADIDVIMASDTTAPIAIRSFYEMEGKRVNNPNKTVFVIDHAAPAPNQKIANLHAIMRAFAKEQSIVFYECGRGICHQLMIEDKRIAAGDLVLGADSHTCTYGAVGAFATGVGATDLAAAMLTGQSWFKIPESIKITLEGEFNPWVSPKDLMLYLVGLFGSNGQTYRSIEFYGNVLESLPLADKMTICNMLVEMGAKNGFICDSSTGLRSDDNALFAEEHTINLADLPPYVSLPHRVDNSVPVEQVKGQPINMAFLGSCTNARVEDLRIAAKILQGKHIADGVRLIISPASEAEFLKAVKDGTVEILIKAGGIFTTSGCGLCVGTLGGVPGDGDVVISTSNRNFKGRMGNNTAEIYLSSPATLAASALKGVICDPREVTL